MSAFAVRRFKIGLAYVGTGHSGFTRNTEAALPSVQAKVEEALGRLLGGVGNHDNFQVSSRTDKGVHAIRNVFSVDFLRKEDSYQKRELTCSSILHGLNFHIEGVGASGITITDVAEVGPEFCARRSCTGRSYIYRVLTPSESGGAGIDPSIRLFHQPLCHIVESPLDIDAMRSAASLFLGEQDFSSLRNSGCQSLSACRNVTQVDIDNAQFDAMGTEIGEDCNLVTFTISANAFLLRMVRNIVGVLLEVGSGRMSNVDIIEKLEARDRSRLLVRPAPAHGLFLRDVWYANEHETRRFD